MVPIKKIYRRNRATSSSVPMTTRWTARSAALANSPLNSPPESPNLTFGTSRAHANVDFLDPSHSPFYMHNGDHPGLVSISIRLDGHNYDDWNAAMKCALDAKNKLGFVDGSLARPLATDYNFRILSRCNSMIKSWLLNSVSSQIYRSILRMDDAAAIWRDLYERFHLTNLPPTFNLTQEIQDLRQGSMTLSVY